MKKLLQWLLSHISVDDMCEALRQRPVVLIVWTPEDMAGFGHEAIPAEVRLQICAKALADASIEHGWEVIEAVLGSNDTED